MEQMINGGCKMKRNEGKREILKENRQKENGINVSETILALLLVSAIFVSVQDLYYSNWCMIAALVAGVLVILLCQVNEVWLNHSGMIRGGIYGVTVVGFLVSITMVVPGFLYTVDRGILLWNARFGTENMQLATGSMAGIGSVILWGLLSVPTASFLLSQIKKRSLWGPVLLVTLAGAFGVILGQTEAWTGMFLTVAALTGIFILYGAPERSFGPYGISYFLSLGVLLVLLVVITEPYESLRMVEQGKQQLEDAFEKFRYGEDSLPQGEFRKAGKLLEGESDTLKITMDVPQELYLRGFVGADYETDGWKKPSAKQYQGEYDDAINKLKSAQIGNMGADLVQIYDLGTRFMIDSGWVVPMQDLIDAAGFDASQLEPNVLAYYTVDNKLYSMPFNSSTPILYYNKDMFEKAGIEEVPTSLEGILAISDQLMSQGGAGEAISIGIYGWFVEQWLCKQGLAFADNGNGREAAATAVEFDSNGGMLNILNCTRPEQLPM